MVRGDILQELCLGQQGCSLKRGNIPPNNLTIISLFGKPSIDKWKQKAKKLLYD